jgi:membrane-associated HD superfamily phosphohydrolase
VNNDREVGEEEDHWYIVPFIVAAGIAVVHFYMKEMGLHRRKMEHAKMLLFVGTVAQVSSLFWKSIGFAIYHYTGADYFLFHLIYLMMHSVSESAIVVLVTLIGFGWTLTFNSGKYFDVFLPLGIHGLTQWGAQA